MRRPRLNLGAWPCLGVRLGERSYVCRIRSAVIRFLAVVWFLGNQAFVYLEEEGKVCKLGWAVPPGVARVGHAPALLLGFHVNRAADLDSIAFGALVPGLKSLV